ncbi:hypothetical protein ACHAWF_006146 [Thalassiosira exigua]
MLDKLLSLGELIVDGDADVAMSKLQGSNITVSVSKDKTSSTSPLAQFSYNGAPRLPSRLLDAESRDDREVTRHGATTHTRSMSTGTMSTGIHTAASSTDSSFPSYLHKSRLLVGFDYTFTDGDTFTENGDTFTENGDSLKANDNITPKNAARVQTNEKNLNKTYRIARGGTLENKETIAREASKHWMNAGEKTAEGVKNKRDRRKCEVGKDAVAGQNEIGRAERGSDQDLAPAVEKDISHQICDDIGSQCGQEVKLARTYSPRKRTEHGRVHGTKSHRHTAQAASSSPEELQNDQVDPNFVAQVDRHQPAARTALSSLEESSNDQADPNVAAQVDPDDMAPDDVDIPDVDAPDAEKDSRNIQPTFSGEGQEVQLVGVLKLGKPESINEPVELTQKDSCRNPLGISNPESSSIFAEVVHKTSPGISKTESNNESVDEVSEFEHENSTIAQVPANEAKKLINPEVNSISGDILSTSGSFSSKKAVTSDKSDLRGLVDVSEKVLASAQENSTSLPSGNASSSSKKSSQSSVSSAIVPLLNSAEAENDAAMKANENTVTPNVSTGQSPKETEEKILTKSQDEVKRVTFELPPPKSKGLFKKNSKGIHIPKLNKRLGLNIWNTKNSTSYIGSSPHTGDDLVSLENSVSVDYLASRKMKPSKTNVTTSVDSATVIESNFQRQSPTKEKELKGVLKSSPVIPIYQSFDKDGNESFESSQHTSIADPAVISNSTGDSTSCDEKRLMGHKQPISTKLGRGEDDSVVVTPEKYIDEKVAANSSDTPSNDDDFVIVSPKTNDDSLEASRAPRLFNMAAVLCKVCAPNNDDKRNTMERVADATYDAVTCGCDETVCNSFDDASYLIPTSGWSTDEEDENGTILWPKGNTNGLFGHSEHETQGVLRVESEDNVKRIISKKNWRKAEPHQRWKVEERPRRMERRDDPVAFVHSAEEMPQKGTKKISLRMPSFKKKKKKHDEFIMDEEIFIKDIFDEIKAERRDNGREALAGRLRMKPATKRGEEFSQDYSNSVASAIAEEAVVSCLNERKRRSKR